MADGAGFLTILIIGGIVGVIALLGGGSKTGGFATSDKRAYTARKSAGCGCGK